MPSTPTQNHRMAQESRGSLQNLQERLAEMKRTNVREIERLDWALSELRGTTAGENEARDYTPLREGPPSVYGRSAQMQTAHLRNEGAADVELNPRSSHQPAQGSSMRVRLLTKGYRQNLVDAALARVPREGLRLIEYYIKALSMLEMRGVEADRTMSFLVDSRLSDKQAIVYRAHTAEQLIDMGFTAEQVFLALLTTQGDRVKALDMLLGTC